jgi:hypothetical protein
MLRLVVEPGPPLRVTLTPGVRTSRSTHGERLAGLDGALVRTVTDWPIFWIGWAVRVAVTTSSATPLAPEAGDIGLGSLLLVGERGAGDEGESGGECGGARNVRIMGSSP